MAVEVPRDVRRAVAAAVAPWRAALPKIRWVPEVNWHVTLKFLGPTRRRLDEWVRGVVEEVAAGQAPIRTCVTGFGAFPSSDHASVIWVGLEDELGRFGALAAELDARLAAEFASETRQFHAHLTVARSRPPIRLPEALSAVALRSAPFTVDRLVLFRSRLRRPSPVYETLRTFPLDGPGPS